MKKTVLIFFMILIACSLFAEEELKVLYMSQSGYQPEVMKKMLEPFEKKEKVKVVITFAKYENMHGKILQSAASRKADYDVVLEDLIWTAEFAKNGFVIPIGGRISKETIDDIAPAVLDAFRYDGKLWAIPFLVNFQLFFYNDEMLLKAGFTAPPKTLEEMVIQMKALKKMNIVKYPWSDSWNKAEGLICEYVWLTGAFGGDTFDNKGRPIFNTGAGKKALEFMKKMLDEGLINPESLNMNEDKTRDNFIEGRSAFNTNWPYQYIDMEKKKIGRMGLIPVAEETLKKYSTTSVSGFQGIAIMSNSDKKEIAWKYVKYITSPQIQGQHFEELPIWKSVQQSKNAKDKIKNLDIKIEQLASVHHRPRVPKYTKVSWIMQEYIYRALKGEIGTAEALDKAVEEIKKIQ